MDSLGTIFHGGMLDFLAGEKETRFMHLVCKISHDDYDYYDYDYVYYYYDDDHHSLIHLQFLQVFVLGKL